MFKKPIIMILTGILFLAACTPALVTPAEPSTPAQRVTVEQAPAGAPVPPGFEGREWADIMAEARGQRVNFYMWGGSDVINGWITGYVGQNLQELYGITLTI